VAEILDRELLVRLKEDDLTALGVLYDRHRQMVYRTALAITGDCEAAADLLQDVFLRLYRFIDRFDVGLPLEPWLYRMTSNLAYTWVKRQKRWLRPLDDFTDWLLGVRRVTPQRPVENMDVADQLQQALMHLPINQRLVVVFYYVNDLSVQEISEILEVPEGTVKSRLHYGRQALRKKLETQHQFFSDVNYEFT